jgi:heat shock protein HtpX
MTPPDRRLASIRRRQRVRNRVQGLVLLGGMVLTLALAAWLLFGTEGLVWVLVLGVLSLSLRPRMRPDWVLRMYRARPLGPAAAPGLHRVVAVLARRAGLPRAPTLYHVPSSMLNAFAVGGPDDAAIGVTDGMLRTLDGRQLTGVLAHEMSHIRSDDLRIMTLADTVSRLTHVIAYVGLLLLVLFGVQMLMAGTVRPFLTALVLIAVPTVVTLLQAALSRAREYDADLAAVELTGDPLGLAAALRTIGGQEGRVWERIMVPHGRTPDPLLLRTHPPTDERVRRLRQLAPSDAPPVQPPPDPRPPAGFGPVAEPPRLRVFGIWR